MIRKLRLLPFLLLALLAGTLSAQFNRRGPGISITAAGELSNGEWSFMRLAYDQANFGGCSGGGMGNTTDYPEAEIHLRASLDRLTRLNTGDEKFLRPDDPRIMDYPWLYAVEVGHWDLDEPAADNLREYFLRGGFLMVDDFHGTDEWAVFTASMSRVFPNRGILEIPLDDPMMKVLYDLDLDERIPIPADQNVGPPQTYQCDGAEPHWRGIWDDENRLMVAINFNMDMGDAWEHADDPRYPEAMTSLATRYAINYSMYSMTH
jgi:hypothetical protein